MHPGRAGSHQPRWTTTSSPTCDVRDVRRRSPRRCRSSRCRPRGSPRGRRPAARSPNSRRSACRGQAQTLLKLIPDAIDERSAPRRGRWRAWGRTSRSSRPAAAEAALTHRIRMHLRGDDAEWRVDRRSYRSGMEASRFRLVAFEVGRGRRRPRACPPCDPRTAGARRPARTFATQARVALARVRAVDGRWPPGRRGARSRRSSPPARRAREEVPAGCTALTRPILAVSPRRCAARSRSAPSPADADGARQPLGAADVGDEAEPHWGWRRACPRRRAGCRSRATAPSRTHARAFDGGDDGHVEGLDGGEARLHWARCAAMGATPRRATRTAATSSSPFTSSPGASTGRAHQGSPSVPRGWRRRARAHAAMPSHMSTSRALSRAGLLSVMVPTGPLSSTCTLLVIAS